MVAGGSRRATCVRVKVADSEAIKLQILRIESYRFWRVRACHASTRYEAWRGFSLPVVAVLWGWCVGRLPRIVSSRAFIDRDL